MRIEVRNNDVEQALRALKRKLQREGVFREMKARAYYEKPSERRVREKEAAISRAKKLERKKLQREGLLPTKAKKRDASPRPQRLPATPPPVGT